MIPYCKIRLSLTDPINVKQLQYSTVPLMSQKRASQSGFTHIKDVIVDIIGNCRVSDNAEFIEIQRIWKHCVENTVIDHAIPASFKNGVLLIHVKSPTLTQQLRYQAKDIIQQINHALGENRISEIKLKIR
jgi:hypothetical protein